MRERRQQLARALLNHQGPPNEDILGLFETMGFYARRGAIDLETTYNNHGYLILNYWPAVKDYVKKIREEDKEWYEHFEWLNDQLLQEYVRRTHQTLVQAQPTTDDVTAFLRRRGQLAEFR